MTTTQSRPRAVEVPPPRAERAGLSLPIAAVERDTGLSKDTLRMWERRYGFPLPDRDAQGERAYPLAQVERLRVIKRLLDAGHRPGRVMGLDVAAMEALLATCATKPGDSGGVATRQLVAAYLAALHGPDPEALRVQLQRDLWHHGLPRFVADVLGPVCTAIGDAWLRGDVAVHQEHRFSEAVQRVLHQALLALPVATADSRPRVLLTTLPGEPHGLGLLMAEAMLTLQGAACVSLGVQTPLSDVVKAARVHGADIVALGFSGSTGERPTIDLLQQLRRDLPAQTAVWLGGRAPVLYRRRLEGVEVFAELAELPPAVRRWQVSGGDGPAGS